MGMSESRGKGEGVDTILMQNGVLVALEMELGRVWRSRRLIFSLFLSHFHDFLLSLLCL
jgi:hypothetical protein